MLQNTMYPSHCNFTLHEYQFQQYPDFTPERATEKGSAKGKSNTSYVIYLFKLHRFWLLFFRRSIYTVFMKCFLQIICMILNLDLFASILSTFLKKITLVSLT